MVKTGTNSACGIIDIEANTLHARRQPAISRWNVGLLESLRFCNVSRYFQVKADMVLVCKKGQERRKVKRKQARSVHHFLHTAGGENMCAYVRELLVFYRSLTTNFFTASKLWTVFIQYKAKRPYLLCLNCHLMTTECSKRCLQSYHIARRLASPAEQNRCPLLSSVRTSNDFASRLACAKKKRENIE